MNIGSFLSQVSKSNYFTYLGSLTTPKCRESVLWTVYTKPIPIGPFQVKNNTKIYVSLLFLHWACLTASKLSSISKATHVTRHPAVWIARNCFQFWTIDIVIPSGYSNLGPKRLSLLEFETWRLRPRGYHGRSPSRVDCIIKMKDTEKVSFD